MCDESTASQNHGNSPLKSFTELRSTAVRIHGADRRLQGRARRTLPPIGNAEGKKSRNWGKRKLARDR
jgi:hypothetical protein